MKKTTIWTLIILVAVMFISLLGMQLYYMNNMVSMRKDQFSSVVKQSLYAVANRLAQDEAHFFLDENVQYMSQQSLYNKYVDNNTTGVGGVKFSVITSNGIEADLTIKGDVDGINNLTPFGPRSNNSLPDVGSELRDRYLLQRSVIDGVVINILSQSSNRPISERADSARVSRYLSSELDSLGLKIPFEFAVVNRAGTVLYRTADFSPTASDQDNMYVQSLFPGDPRDRLTYLKVYFPTKNSYIYSSTHAMIPTIAFTFILLIIFVVTIALIIRQKKLSEMKNDFINNMTHEFKTPISSISLAAQMLNDPAVRKSPAMLQQISSVINDETKRLRFQVEKVLQMSMFDRQKARLKLEDVDANAIIYNVVNTFKLKVEKYGGKLSANLDAMDAIIVVDEMHFTNVIFNLLDNAVKYRNEDRPLQLNVSTHDISNDRLEITIADNGIGIRRDDLKKIFEKFYRVSTGNRHDVKGFGLGLAYVDKMVKEFGGQISVESEINNGTKFKIILPLSKTE